MLKTVNDWYINFHVSFKWNSFLSDNCHVSTVLSLLELKSQAKCYHHRIDDSPTNSNVSTKMYMYMHEYSYPGQAFLGASKVIGMRTRGRKAWVWLHGEAVTCMFAVRTWSPARMWCNTSRDQCWESSSDNAGTASWDVGRAVVVPRITMYVHVHYVKCAPPIRYRSQS